MIIRSLKFQKPTFLIFKKFKKVTKNECSCRTDFEGKPE
jgi:hypothetical protein